jgi:hypothetical protein
MEGMLDCGVLTLTLIDTDGVANAVEAGGWTTGGLTCRGVIER